MGLHTTHSFRASKLFTKCILKIRSKPQMNTGTYAWEGVKPVRVHPCLHLHRTPFGAVQVSVVQEA